MTEESQEITSAPPTVRASFSEWRKPQRGTRQAQRMNNPVWEWFIETRINAYHANKLLDGPSSIDAGPCWCFDRFGQSETILTDGRKVFIGGEHEDHYDPDFYIYNDVVVISPTGEAEIFGYPEANFPPTDFHSATLIDDFIWIIGSLGYPESRTASNTQVLKLSLANWHIEQVTTHGSAPGWIHDHFAEYDDHERTIKVTHGQLDTGSDNGSLIENIDDWALNIDDGQWTRLSERRWPRFELARSDIQPNHLWECREAIWTDEVGWEDDHRESMESLEQQLGKLPQLDLVKRLYQPPIEHTEVPAKQDQYGVHRIRIDGVVVRYVEETYTVQITIEGDLPTSMVETLTDDCRGKFEAIELHPITVNRLGET